MGRRAGRWVGTAGRCAGQGAGRPCRPGVCPARRPGGAHCLGPLAALLAPCFRQCVARAASLYSAMHAKPLPGTSQPPAGKLSYVVPFQRTAHPLTGAPPRRRPRVSDARSAGTVTGATRRSSSGGGQGRSTKGLPPRGGVRRRCRHRRGPPGMPAGSSSSRRRKRTRLRGASAAHLGHQVCGPACHSMMVHRRALSSALHRLVCLVCPSCSCLG